MIWHWLAVVILIIWRLPVRDGWQPICPCSPAWYAEPGGTVWLDSALRMKTMERQSFFAAFGQLDFRIPPFIIR